MLYPGCNGWTYPLLLATDWCTDEPARYFYLAPLWYAPDGVEETAFLGE